MIAPAATAGRRAEEGRPVHIVFQVHHADADEALRAKATRALHKLATRLRHVVDATVRVAADGALRRVEITVRASRRPDLVAVGAGRQGDAALTEALGALEAQIAHERAARARRLRRLGIDPMLLQPLGESGEETLEA
jgi:ribosome-associated translation inhibitor RaiA